MTCVFNPANLEFNNEISVILLNNKRRIRHTSLYLFENKMKVYSVLVNQGSVAANIVERQVDDSIYNFQRISYKIFSNIGNFSKQSAFLKDPQSYDLPLKTYLTAEETEEKISVQIKISQEGSFLFLALYHVRNYHGLYYLLISVKNESLRLTLRGFHNQVKQEVSYSLKQSSFVQS